MSPAFVKAMFACILALVVLFAFACWLAVWVGRRAERMEEAEDVVALGPEAAPGGNQPRKRTEAPWKR